MNIQKFIDAIVKEEEGFSFGKPWRYTKNSLTAILPILRESQEARKYITLAEAEKVTIEDTGNIDSALITNKEDKPVFVRAGELLKGKTQERVVVISRVIMPNESARVKVVCVHASKPISGGAVFSAGGFTPRSVEDTMLRSAFDEQGGGIQSRVWNAVNAFSMSANLGKGLSNVSMREDFNDLVSAVEENYTGPTVDDLVKNMETFSKSIEEVLRSVPKVDWQTGAALLGVDGLIGLEAFDLADSWTAIREDVIKKEGEDIIKEDKDAVFEYKPEKAKTSTTTPLKKKFTEKDLFKSEHSQTVALETEGYVGEVTLLANKVIHLNLTKKN